MVFASWKNFCQVVQSSRNAARGYGTTVAKGKVGEHALKLRGRIPAEKNDYRLFAGAVAALSLYAATKWYANYRREEIVRKNYEQIVNSNYGPWHDFENRRMPKFAKILANDSPCGDAFKDAYKCSTFGEGGCSEQFEAFLGCVKENPMIMRDIKPDGKYNWESKLFLHNLLTEKKHYDALIASVGPAEEDMDDVYNSYRAREILGANASEKQVSDFKAKFSSLRDEFWSEVEALHEGTKTDYSRADQLLKLLIKDYSIPEAVWLQAMKDYDLEEFDEAVTMARRKFGTVLRFAERLDKIKEMRDVDLGGVTCGSQFEKMYECMDNKRDHNDCLDYIDELYFCRQHHYKQVFPRPTHMDCDVRYTGVDLFQKPNESFKAEIQRPQEIMGYPGIVF